MISDELPNTWQNLQDRVAEILGQCGFDAKVEVPVNLVRGTVNVDVVAEEEIKGRINTIFCECKFWKNPVPQHVAHGFRTVVADAGANTGYIIAKTGFQSGAFEAAKNTNIKLVTWEEFLSEFEEIWIERYFIPTVTENLDPLMTYAEPLLPLWFAQLSELEQATYVALVDEYAGLGMLSMRCSTYHQMLRKTDLPALPLCSNDEVAKLPKLPARVLKAASYSELLFEMSEAGTIAIQQFRQLRDKATAAK